MRKEDSVSNTYALNPLFLSFQKNDPLPEYCMIRHHLLMKIVCVILVTRTPLPIRISTPE
jgi:hypothetical protein